MLDEDLLNYNKMDHGELLEAITAKDAEIADLGAELDQASGRIAGLVAEARDDLLDRVALTAELDRLLAAIEQYIAMYPLGTDAPELAGLRAALEESK